MPKPIIVNGVRYKPIGCALQAFDLSFSVLSLTDRNPDLAEYCRTRRDDFIKAMPEWLAAETVTACEELSARIKELRGDV
jgi:hypothetical protein